MGVGTTGTQVAMTDSTSIDDDVRATIVGCHHDAAEGIDALVASLPAEVDGGIGSLDLVAVVAAAATTAGRLADVQVVLAGSTDAAGSLLLTTDDDVRAAVAAVSPGVAP